MTEVKYEDVSPSGNGTIRTEVPKRYNKQPIPSPLDGPDEYTVKSNKRGRRMYMKNGRLISPDDVPTGTMVRDIDAETQAEAERVARSTDEAVRMAIGSLDLSNKECLWQDGLGDFMRFVSGRMVYLCEDHYLHMNLGKISHKLQERANGEGAGQS